MLRLSVGIFLVCYAISQLSGLTRLAIGAWGGRPSDAAVGVGGGILGGFAGLSEPLPLIWLQLRGGPSEAPRSVSPTFNNNVLPIADAGMQVPGRGDGVLIASPPQVCPRPDLCTRSD